MITWCQFTWHICVSQRWCIYRLLLIKYSYFMNYSLPTFSIYSTGELLNILLFHCIAFLSTFNLNQPIIIISVSFIITISSFSVVQEFSFAEVQKTLLAKMLLSSCCRSHLQGINWKATANVPCTTLEQRLRRFLPL